MSPHLCHIPRRSMPLTFARPVVVPLLCNARHMAEGSRLHRSQTGKGHRHALGSNPLCRSRGELAFLIAWLGLGIEATCTCHSTLSHVHAAKFRGHRVWESRGDCVWERRRRCGLGEERVSEGQSIKFISTRGSSKWFFRGGFTNRLAERPYEGTVPSARAPPLVI